jgi:uncharacterized protein YjiS (DUF1127 family)
VDDSATDDGEIFETTVFLHHFKELTDTRQQAKVVYPLDEVTQHAALAEAARLPWDTGRRPRRQASPGAFADLQRAWHGARTRRLLAVMTAHELRDIGVTPSDAEANKPVWRT